MNRVVLDFETYYDRDYSLTKLTTEEYIRDERFEAIGVAIKINDEPAQWYPQMHIEKGLRTVDWENSLVIGQNMMFDAAILAWRFNRKARAWGDTLGMSRALFPHDKAHGLAAQAKRHSIGMKGDEVINALGKRHKDFTEEQLARYGEYCINDVELTTKLFDLYATDYKFPVGEMKLIDATLRMFVEPKLVLDAPLLREYVVEVRETQEALLAAVNVDRAQFMSNKQFAELLREYGVEPPTKISLTTGKETYAFAKTDEDFKRLMEEHPDPRVNALVAARLGVKSTIEETRAERFLQMSNRGAFPVPLRYYGAHSGRWSGQDKVNLQNLPARDPTKNTLKRAIKAPPGYVIIDCDSSQIEARTLAWLAGQMDLVDAFANKQDVYRLMAAQIYGVAPDQVDKTQRQVGKTVILGCIAEGELVLTDHGLVPIEQVTTSMRVWDGVEWVTHEGPIYQGEQEVMTYDQVTATPDHIVYLPDGTSCRFDQAAATGRCIANTGDGGVPIRYGGDHIYGAAEAHGETTFVHSGAVPRVSTREVDQPNECAQGIDQRLPDMQPTAHAADMVGQTNHRHEATLYQPPTSKLAALRGTGCGVPVSVSDRSGALGDSQSWAAQGQGVGSDQYERALRARESGVVHAPRESIAYQTDSAHPEDVRISDQLPGGTLRRCDAEADVCLDDRPRDCAGIQPSVAQTKRRVWDILNAGPRHRFTVSGRLVSNCGYGVGHAKLRLFLKTGAKVEVSEEEAKRIIDTYRRTYYRIPELWKRADTALAMLAAQMPMPVDAQQLVHVVPGKGLSLPSGLHIQYPDLRQFADEEGQLRWHYTSRGRIVAVYGGKCVENFTQAVARCVVGEQMLRIAKRYTPVLTVHDAVACIAPEEEAEEAQRYVEECMSWRPRWAGTLPLACEAGRGASYGDC